MQLKLLTSNNPENSRVTTLHLRIRARIHMHIHTYTHTKSHLINIHRNSDMEILKHWKRLYTCSLVLLIPIILRNPCKYILQFFPDIHSNFMFCKTILDFLPCFSLNLLSISDISFTNRDK
jgi:hypothetical protein